MILIELTAGTDIIDACQEAVRTAVRTREKVAFDFNGITMSATEESDPVDMVNEYRRASGYEKQSELEYFAAHAPPPPEWWGDAPPVKQKRLRELANPDGTCKIHGEAYSRKAAWQQWGDSLDDNDIHPNLLEEFKSLKEDRERVALENNHAIMLNKTRHAASWAWAYARAMVFTSPKT